MKQHDRGNFQGWVVKIIALTNQALLRNEVRPVRKSKSNFLIPKLIPRWEDILLRVTDSKYRESLDRFEKSKTLKLCLKNAFREFCSKN